MFLQYLVTRGERTLIVWVVFRLLPCYKTLILLSCMNLALYIIISKCFWVMWNLYLINLIFGVLFGFTINFLVLTYILVASLFIKGVRSVKAILATFVLAIVIFLNLFIGMRLLYFYSYAFLSLSLS